MGQKKRGSRAQRKAEAEKERNGIVSGGTQNPKDNEADSQPEQSYKLTAYTGAAMVNVIVAAVTTVLAMVVYAKPFYYYLQTVYGGLSEYDLEYTEAMALSDADYTRIDTLFLLAALPVLVATVLALVNVATATNPEKKPAFIPAIIGFVLSAAGAALYIYGTFYIKGLLVDNPYVDGVELMYRFALFGGCFIAIIINAVLAFINIFSVKSGRNKWKETGRAY